MIERERLKDLLKEIRKHPQITCPKPNIDSCYRCRYDLGGVECDIVSRIADHLFANGVIVSPCKIGDMVYVHDKWGRTEDICSYQITNLTITQNKKGVWTKKYRAMWFVNGKTVDAQFNFEFEDIGKTVFLTKDEAEKALKKKGKQ